MRFLVDNSLSPRFAHGLVSAGHDAIHVRDLRMSSADDESIFAHAAEAGLSILSMDTDFATILAMRQESRPSLVLFRARVRSTDALLKVFSANFPRVEEDLQTGAVVVFEDARIRVRPLPITRPSRM